MTGAEPSAPVWRYPVRYEDVSRDGRVLDIAADPATRAAIAAEADIEALHRLAATLRLRRWRRDGLAVEGRYEAAMTRICVVSLDPFEVEVSGDFERRYLPVDPDRAVDNVTVDPEAEDPPDPLPPEGADMAALVLEEFLLGLDPYPRKPGVAFAPDDAENAAETGAKDNPFAVLTRLRDKGPE
ncbi:MAG: DUF177 domain-containing protein [Rhodobiaceae bacterium]|nr:DUF177 domain-containing protein [Rhodobiaceae bacterium]